MDADELSGRQLDFAVARHVFGLEVEERVNVRTGEKDAVCREPGKDWLRVPFYGISLTASINVEVALQDQGWKRQRGQEAIRWQELGVVRVILEHADGRMVEAVGPINEAICVAALRAVRQALIVTPAGRSLSAVR